MGAEDYGVGLRQAVRAIAVSTTESLDSPTFENIALSHLGFPGHLDDSLTEMLGLVHHVDVRHALRLSSEFKLDAAFKDSPLIEGSSFIKCGGSGRQVVPEVIGFEIAAGSLTRWYLSNSKLSADCIEGFIFDTLDGLAELQLGDRFDGFMAMAFSGETLSAEALNFETPWGEIVPPPSPLGQRVGRKSPASFVLVSPVAGSLQRTSDDIVAPGGLLSSEMQDHWDRMRKAGTFLPLAFVLAGDPEDPMNLTATWNSSVGLLGTPGASWSGVEGSSRLGSVERSFDAAKVFDWCQRLQAMDGLDGGIEVAQRRLLSAVKRDRHQEDRLVDAVMVWENLLGNENEVSFSASASLAHLVSNSESRLEDYQTFKKVYNARSRIVHGGHIDQRKLNKHVQTATHAAIDALGEVYNRGPEWIAMTGPERVQRLLVGDPAT